jgi:TRAP-type C4-dicarboxylate transport system substrate-binding protein
LKEEKMKKLAALSWISLFSLVLITSGLSVTPAAAKPIELSLSHTIPPQIPFGKLTQQWADMVAEKTNNQVKINIYWGESLLKAAEFYRGVQTGQTDITYYVVGLDWGLMPLNMFSKLAFMEYPSMEAGTAIYKKIWDKFPEIRNEFKQVRVYGAEMSPPNHLHFTKKVVKVPADIKGMKIIALGGTMAEEMAAMGAAPIDVKVGDLYMSLDRGMAEGVSIHWPVMHGFGILKLTPYHTVFPGGTLMSVDMLLFNQKSWDKLPDDVQKVFLELEPWYTEQVIKMNTGYINMVKGMAKEMGHEIYEPTAEEMELWKQAVQPVRDKWITNTEAKGLPARTVYEEAKRLSEEYRR